MLKVLCVLSIERDNRLKKSASTVEPVYNGHPWDQAKWLLYRGVLLIEVGGALGLY